MSDKQHFDDKLLYDLMKKSLQQPQSSNFDDKLMEKIVQIPLITAPQKNGTALDLGKRYFLLALGFLLLSVFISGQVLNGYFTGLTNTLSLATNYIFFGGMGLLIPVLLFMLDALLKEKYASRKQAALMNI